MRAHTIRAFHRHDVALAVLVLLGTPGAGFALPQGAQVVAGQLTVGTPAAGRLGIVQSSGRAIVDWRSFGIGAGEAVTLAQPGGGVALFRVTGREASGIFGSLSATGQLFLSNPSGVLFGPNARADVGSLVATTLGTGNADFLAGRYRFAGDSRASVVNQGRIDAAGGGSVVLLGASVANRGTINAPQGSVALGAGSAATLDVYGNGLLKLNLTAGADDARIDHGGSISADGGVASAAALGRGAVLNIDGVIRASSLTEHDGAIYLSGGSGSQLKLAGTLDASAAPGAAGGGRIEVTGERITIGPSARLLADASSTGKGGTVTTIASETMTFSGAISARGGAGGGDGGQAEVSGLQSLSVTGRADLSAPRGRFGTLLLDPGSISIVDGTGTNTGPNTFDDAYLATALGLANVTLATAAATNGGSQVIQVSSAANVTWGAATTLTLNAGQNITMFGGAVIRNTNAGATAFDAIVLNGNAGNTSTSANGHGVAMAPGSVLETTRGNILITGHGADTGNFNQGVLIQGTAGNGPVVRTADGRIAITGTGGTSATAGSSRGVSIETAATIEATGSGSVSLVGNGTNGTSDIGVLFIGGAPTVRTTIGALSISGTGTGPLYGIAFSNSAATIASTSGSITLGGAAGNPGVPALFSAGAAVTLGGAGTSGSITLSADRMDLTQLTASTTRTLVVQPLTAGRVINVGAADTLTTLGLSIAELGGFTAGRLEIGNASAGNLAVNQAYAPTAGTGTLALISGGTVGVNAAITGGNTRLSLSGTAGVRLGAALSSNAANVAATRAISIRTPGTFNNTVGAAALSTPNGSWAVSLATPLGQTFNGLLSNNVAVWSNPVTSSVNPTGNRYSFALAPTIFVDAGSVAKVYGDVLPSTVTLVAAPVAPLVNTFGGVFTDYQTGTLSGSYGLASTGLAGTAGVGSYASTVTDVAQLTTTKAGYGFAIGRAGTVNVSQRPITVAPDPVSRLYGDANPPTSSGSPIVGTLVNGDTIGSVALSSVATATSNAGSYDTVASNSNVVFSAGSAANYLISAGTRVNGLTVLPRPVTLAPGGVSRVYGDANPGRAAATGGLVNGDAASVAIATVAGVMSNVGGYPTSASDAVFTAGLASNYTIGYASNATGLAVTPRALTLAPDVVSRVYGDANPARAPAVGALVNGDTASIAIGSAAGVTSNVGSYPTTASDAAFTVGLASNYTIGYAPNPVGLSVTPRPVQLMPDAVTRVYGAANPTSATASVVGGSLVNGDTVASVALTTPATVASNVGPYPTDASNAVFGTGAAGNYTITYVASAGGLVITPRPLTLTADPAARAYGETNPGTGTATGGAGQLVNGDTVASISLVSPATAASPVGNYDLTGSAAVFGTGLASNYTIAYATAPGALTVGPRGLTLTPVGLGVVYGDAPPASALAQAAGLVNGDSVTALAITTPATSASNAGTYASTGTSASFGSGSASNYTISFATNPAGVTIGPRPLTLTPVTVSRSYGDANPASGGATGNSLVNGDAVASVALASSATTASPVGSYGTTASSAVFGTGLASNYAISYAMNPAGLTVTPRPLTLTPVAVSRIYGDANPASAGALGNNLVNGDTVASITLASSATPASNVGSYDTTGSNAVFGSGLASNYTIAYATNPAGLAITPRALTLTPDAVTRAYGDANPANGTATANNLVNGDTVANVALASPASTGTGVGSYGLTASNAQFGSGSAANYTITYAPNTTGLQVAPRAVAVTVPAGQFKFTGQPDPALTFTLTGGTLVAGDAFVGSLVRASGEAPGPYPIGQGSLSLGPNYTIGFTGAPFTVTAAGQLATIDRTPSTAAPASTGTAFATLLASLPPTAAGNPDGTTECVREAVLDRAQLGASRIVNRGIRLPEGVVDACR